MSDLIRRQDAIDAIQKLPNAGIQWFVNAESVFKVLEELPSAERKHGKWIHYDEGDFDYDYKCSLCGYAVWDNSDYCPNCGARMCDSND